MKTNMTAEPEIQTLLSGVWHNQHNSELRLEIDQSGKLSGLFTPGVEAQGSSLETFPVIGFAKDDIFSFCVDFSKYGSMTTWIGQFVNPKSSSFRATWHMIADIHHDKRLDWKSLWTGQDEFIAGPRTEESGEHPSPKSHPLYNSII